MNKTTLAVALSALVVGAANAHENHDTNTSHVRNSAGEMVKNRSGECVRADHHNQGDDVADCYGTVKAQIPEPVPVVPAPVVPAPVVEEKKEVLNSIRKVSLGAGTTFNFGSSMLTSAGRAELDSLVQKIKMVEQGVTSIIVEGHTDSVGSDAFNQNLSQERAESVRSYLVRQGVDSSKITAQGYGESQPVASNSTSEGRAQNRRVNIRVDGEIVETVNQDQ